MRAVFALAAFLAFAPNAIAAMNGGDKQFSTNVEFRTRYTFEDNQSGTKDLAPNNGNTVESRLRLGGTYKVSEKFGVTATFLDNFNWGSQDLYIYNTNGTPGASSSGDGVATHSGASSNNLLLVQEAYGYWMLSEDMLFRFGRGSLQLADGAVIGTNDYDPIPNSFDGVLGTYEFDFGRISAWAVKIATYDNGLSGKMAAGAGSAYTGAGSSGNASSSPEADGYGLSFDLKKMPEVLKMVNLHVIQNTKATTPGAAFAPWVAADPLSTMGQNTVRYGTVIGGAASIIDYHVDAEGVTGNYFCQGVYTFGCKGTTQVGGATSTITSLNTNQYMAQLEAGLNFPEFMKARIFAKAHRDSGNNNPSEKISTYDPYFYNKAEGSGMMQVVGWGNLTFYNAGLTVAPGDQTTFGIQYFIFEKTNKEGNMNPGRYGDMVGFTSPNSSALGQEIDLWGEHKYDGGFSILAHAGVFMPGTSVKNGMAENATAKLMSSPANPLGPQAFPAGVSRDSTFTQFVVQGKMSF